MKEKPTIVPKHKIGNRCTDKCKQNCSKFLDEYQTEFLKSTGHQVP